MSLSSNIGNAYNEIRLAPLNYSNITNWHDLVLFRFRRKKRVVLRLKNLSSVGLERHPDCIEVEYKARKFRFHYDSKAQFKSTLFFIREQFIEEQYDYLQPKGKVIVDIGANVGDTALYFMSKGAKKVYAIEPNPYFYELAKKNLKESAAGQIVQIENAGAGGEHKSAKALQMLGEFKDMAGGYSKRKDIQILTLPEIVKRFKINRAVMKIDCEGCEYWLIMNAPINVLKRFDRIVIAHHFNYVPMEKKLQKAGFKVRHTPTQSVKDAKDKNDKNLYTRLIFAEK
jgi:FkbM family methyltransferase